ncbi:MAG: FMN-binding protein [Planctomycetota bacterium]|jgi:Na+-transporting NADH:ubiquinone oxidoreductase subunit C
MREKRWFPILYMFVATAFFSSVVIGFTNLTRRRVEANAELAFERAVVAVLPQLCEPGVSALEVHRRFTEQVTEPNPTSGGAYTFQQNGRIAGYALPIAGQGFWAPIKGVIGIAADRKTVTGCAIYEQNETPGLGGEVAQPPFQEQFEGKMLSSEAKPIGFRRPGESLGESEVHAVTGATQTSTRLEGIINESLKTWQSQVGREDATQ